MKDNNYKLIKRFTKINIKGISKKLNIDSSNVFSGKTTKENYIKIKDELIKELGVLFIDEISKNVIMKYIEEIKKEFENLKYDETLFDIEVTLNKIGCILDEMEQKLWE